MPNNSDTVKLIKDRIFAVYDDASRKNLNDIPELNQAIQAFADVIVKAPKPPILLLNDMTLADLLAVFSKESVFSLKYIKDENYASCNVLLLEAFLGKPSHLKAALEKILARREKRTNELRGQLFAENVIHSKITQDKSLTTNFAIRDANGRHIVQYAALAGNYDNLVFLLDDEAVLKSITNKDKVAIMECAVASGSYKCILYLIGTFAIKPKSIPSLEQTTEIGKLPLKTRAEIEKAFAYGTTTDEELYKFLDSIGDGPVQINKNSVLKSYLLFGGSLEMCEKFLARLRNLELSPLMLKSNYRIELIINNQLEFAELLNKYDTSALSAKERVIYDRIRKVVPHIKPLSNAEAEDELIEALRKGDLATCHSLTHRYHEVSRRVVVEKFELIVGEGHVHILEYYLKLVYDEITSRRDSNSELLNLAVRNKKAPMVRFLIERCGFNEAICVDNVTALSTSVLSEDNPVMPYLLNRCKFLLGGNRDPKYNEKHFREFQFSKEGLRNLFVKKSGQELKDYLKFIDQYIKGHSNGLIYMYELSNEERLDILNKLFILEREMTASGEDPNQVILLQSHILRTFDGENYILDDPKDPKLKIMTPTVLYDASTRGIYNRYQKELAQHYTDCLEIISDPLKSKEQRAIAMTVLETSAKENRADAASSLRQAQKIETMRLSQLVDNQQGDVSNHLSQLEKFEAAGIVDAKEYLYKHHIKLSVELRNNALAARDTQAEAKLRHLAKTHPYAQLQLAILLIQRYQSSPLKLVNRQNANEARKIVCDQRVAQFPEAHYYHGICLSEGIGGNTSIEKAMHYYFLAAKENCQLGAEVLKSLNKTKLNLMDQKSTSCRAAIYSALLTLLNGTEGYYSAFDTLAEKYNSLFFQCMISVAEHMNDFELKIKVLQVALARVKTNKDKDSLNAAMMTTLMQLNQNKSVDSLSFAHAVNALNPEQCLQYALRFIIDDNMKHEARCAWLVAADMKKTAPMIEKQSKEWSSLQTYLARISKEDQEKFRRSLQIEPQPSVVASNSSPVPAAAVPSQSSLLQDRYTAAAEYAGPLPDELTDPNDEELMTDPGVCNDERIYDRRSFEKMKGKKAPLNSAITIEQFTPIQTLRAKAIKYIEDAERAKALAEANHQPASNVMGSATLAVQSGMTFFAAPSAPPMEPASVKNAREVPASAPKAVKAHDDDDGDLDEMLPRVVRSDDLTDEVNAAIFLSQVVENGVIDCETASTSGACSSSMLAGQG